MELKLEETAEKLRMSGKISELERGLTDTHEELVDAQA